MAEELELDTENRIGEKGQMGPRMDFDTNGEKVAPNYHRDRY